jgi:ABC-type nitrate/sulfonate/bicarbonate transport system substrate-binding protein
VAHIVPAIVAKEMTYFEEEGLEDYEIVTGGLVPGLVEKIALRRAMKEKGIDVVADPKPVSVFTHRNRGEDLFIVGCWRNHQSFRFFARKGLNSLRDLKGKRIGTRDYGGISNVVMRLHLKRAGLEPERDVEWVRGSRYHIARMTTAEALREGDVDCVPVPQKAAERLLTEGYPCLLDTRKLYAHGVPVRVIATTRRVLEEKREVLESYLRATIRAYWFIMDSEKNQDYINALNRRLRKQSPDEEEQKMGVLEGTSSSDVLPLDGAPSMEGLKIMLEEAKEMNEVPDGTRVEDAVELGAVKRAYEALCRREELAPALKRAREIYQRTNRMAAA